MGNQRYHNGSFLRRSVRLGSSLSQGNIRITSDQHGLGEAFELGVEIILRRPCSFGQSLHLMILQPEHAGNGVLVTIPSLPRLKIPHAADLMLRS